jgi:acyl-coenzyme A thioesterase PaaI-like protein
MTQASLMPWTRLFAHAHAEPGRASLVVTPDWLQGRTVFGGLQAALALRAMRTLVPEVPLRTLQGTFLAPVPEGPLTATARVLRTGKSATHVEARLMDGDALLATLVGVFGAARASVVKLEPRQEPVDAATARAFPYIPGAMPAFTQHFKARLLRGAFPYTGDAGVEHVFEVAMRDDGPVTEGHVLAVADFVPPIGLAHLKAPAPGSTLTWMVELLANTFNGLPLDGWRVDVTMDHARDGYTGQSVMVWGPGGVPLAMSRQSMVVFG